MTYKDAELRSVVTRGVVACSKTRLWHKVCFYEHVSVRPHWLVRLVLPAPVQSDGHHMGIGRTSRCRYSDGGHLTKRITRVIENKRVDFEIIEQTIRFHRQVPLHGGAIILNEQEDGSTRVALVTRYRNLLRPDRLTDIAVCSVIRSLHRTTLADMRAAVATDRSYAPQRASGS